MISAQLNSVVQDIGVKPSRNFGGACFTVVTLLVALPLFADEQLTVRGIAAAAKSGVATVHTYANDKEIAFGTGFFIREDGVLVTNLHVVEGGDSVSVETESGEIYDNVYVLSRDDRRDLILLQIPVSGVPFLDIADDRHTEVGDTVYVIGNPLGLKGTFSDGLLSARRLENGVSYLQISAPISQGSSGGPVLNSAGQVIGVSTLTYVDGQNLNLAIPARYASGLIGLGSDPVPFASISSELQPTPGETLDDRASTFAAMIELMPDDVRADLEDMNKYQAQVAIQLVASSLALDEEGWSFSDDDQEGVLEPNGLAALSVNLERGIYGVLGFCDADCSDLDIYVMDENDEILAQDVLDDAEPGVDFTVTRAGKYIIGAKMISCATDACWYWFGLVHKE